jgi:hypothetical protein
VEKGRRILTVGPSVMIVCVCSGDADMHVMTDKLVALFFRDPQKIATNLVYILQLAYTRVLKARRGVTVARAS